MQQGPPSKPATPAEVATSVPQAPMQKDASADKPAATVKLPNSSTTPAPPPATQNGPPPPTESKPNVNDALAPPAPSVASNAPPTYANTAAKTAPIVTKSGRIQPAIPLASPAAKPKLPVNKNVAATSAAPNKVAAPRSTPAVARSDEESARAAREAVAAAMAKIGPPPAQPKKQVNGESVADNLTNKVNEMRVNDGIRTSRQPGTGGYAAGHRGRGGGRGGRAREEQATRRVEVPKTDYDFAEANAKFNKQDLVKEAIATGSPIGSPNDMTTSEDPMNGARRASEQSVTIPAAPGYSKSSSFFDNLSSESKDREDKKLGGREFRSEEQKKNFETFGQGSVDNGYRGGYRGRGRGRGGYRGTSRGGGYSSSRGRGAPLSRGGAVAAES